MVFFKNKSSEASAALLLRVHKKWAPSLNSIFDSQVEGYLGGKGWSGFYIKLLSGECDAKALSDHRTEAWTHPWTGFTSPPLLGQNVASLTLLTLAARSLMLLSQRWYSSGRGYASDLFSLGLRAICPAFNQTLTAYQWTNSIPNLFTIGILQQICWTCQESYAHLRTKWCQSWCCYHHLQQTG